MSNTYAFVSWTADKLSARISRLAMVDNAEDLKLLNQRIEHGNLAVKAWFEEVGGEYLSVQGTEGFGKIPGTRLDELPDLHEKMQAAWGGSVSMGVGLDLSEAQRSCHVASKRGGGRILFYTDELAEEEKKETKDTDPISGLNKADPMLGGPWPETWNGHLSRIDYMDKKLKTQIFEELNAADALGKEDTELRLFGPGEHEDMNLKCQGASWDGEEAGYRKGSILMCPEKPTHIRYIAGSPKTGRGMPSFYCDNCVQDIKDGKVDKDMSFKRANPYIKSEVIEEDLAKMAKIHDSDKEPLTLYRVQDEFGRGPYNAMKRLEDKRPKEGSLKRERLSRMYDTLVRDPDSTAREGNQPLPRVDFTNESYREITNSPTVDLTANVAKDKLFAFSKPEDAAKWFGTAALERLKAQGFKLVPVLARRAWNARAGATCGAKGCTHSPGTHAAPESEWSGQVAYEPWQKSELNKASVEDAPQSPVGQGTSQRVAQETPMSPVMDPTGASQDSEAVNYDRENLPEQPGTNPTGAAERFHQMANLTGAQEARAQGQANAADKGQSPEFEQIKQQIAAILMKIKQQAPVLEQIKQQAPDVYEAVLGSVQAMIAMAHEMMGAEQEEGQKVQEPTEKSEDDGLSPVPTYDFSSFSKAETDYASAEEPEHEVKQTPVKGNPDAKNKGTLKFALGTNKVRKIRSWFENSGISSINEKELPIEIAQGLSKVGKGYGGVFTMDNINRWIDSRPTVEYPFSHDYGVYGRTKDEGEVKARTDQRHRRDIKQNIFRLHMTEGQMKQIKDAGVWEHYMNMLQVSKQSGHPVSPGVIGWVRWTGDKHGVLADEIQSDYGRKWSAIIDFQLKGHPQSLIDDFHQNKLPDSSWKKINEILFHGKHASEVLGEAYFQWMRENGYEGAPIHIWDASSKTSRAGLTEGMKVPGWVNKTYNEVPEKLGLEDGGIYGQLHTETNAKNKGATMKHGKIHKAEENDGLSFEALHGIIEDACPYSVSWMKEQYGPQNIHLMTPDKRVRRALYCVTPTAAVQNAFRRGGYDILLTHHPYTAEKDIPQWITHTALDCCEGGLNDQFRDAIGMKNAKHFDGTLGWHGEVEPTDLKTLINKCEALCGKKLIGEHHGHNHPIKSVVICTGLGGMVEHTAHKTGADCYILGEATRHHSGSQFKARIETGHTISESTPGVNFYRKILGPHGIQVDGADHADDVFRDEVFRHTVHSPKFFIHTGLMGGAYVPPKVIKPPAQRSNVVPFKKAEVPPEQDDGLKIHAVKHHSLQHSDEGQDELPYSLVGSRPEGPHANVNRVIPRVKPSTAKDGRYFAAMYKEIQNKYPEIRATRRYDSAANKYVDGWEKVDPNTGVYVEVPRPSPLERALRTRKLAELKTQASESPWIDKFFWKNPEIPREVKNEVLSKNPNISDGARIDGLLWNYEERSDISHSYAVDPDEHFKVYGAVVPSQAVRAKAIQLFMSAWDSRHPEQKVLGNYEKLSEDHKKTIRLPKNAQQHLAGRFFTKNPQQIAANPESFASLVMASDKIERSGGWDSPQPFFGNERDRLVQLLPSVHRKNIYIHSNHIDRGEVDPDLLIELADHPKFDDQILDNQLPIPETGIRKILERNSSNDTLRYAARHHNFPIDLAEKHGIYHKKSPIEAKQNMINAAVANVKNDEKLNPEEKASFYGHGHRATTKSDSALSVLSDASMDSTLPDETLEKIKLGVNEAKAHYKDLSAKSESGYDYAIERRGEIASDISHAVDKQFLARDPSKVYPGTINVRLGSNKMRMLRDHIEKMGVESVRPNDLPRELVNAVGKVGRERNGNYSAKALQAAIDALPSFKFHYRDSNKWGKPGRSLAQAIAYQQHSATPSNVFELAPSKEAMAAINALPEKDSSQFWQNQGSPDEGHPHWGAGLGWVRWTGDKEKTKSGRPEVHTDEIQTDIDNPEVHMAAIHRMQGGKKQPVHPSEYHMEAFLEYLRQTGWTGAKVHIWTPESKAPLSNLNMNKELPAHFKVGYRRVPEKLGWTEGKYGELDTQSTAKFKNKPTLRGELHKAEENPAMEEIKPITLDHSYNSILGHLPLKYHGAVQFAHGVGAQNSVYLLPGQKVLKIQEHSHAADADAYINRIDRLRRLKLSTVVPIEDIGVFKRDHENGNSYTYEVMKQLRPLEGLENPDTRSKLRATRNSMASETILQHGKRHYDDHFGNIMEDTEGNPHYVDLESLQTIPPEQKTAEEQWARQHAGDYKYRLKSEYSDQDLFVGSADEAEEHNIPRAGEGKKLTGEDIARDHLKEDPKYYEEKVEMEPQKDPRIRIPGRLRKEVKKKAMEGLPMPEATHNQRAAGRHGNIPDAPPGVALPELRQGGKNMVDKLRVKETLDSDPIGNPGGQQVKHHQRIAGLALHQGRGVNDAGERIGISPRSIYAKAKATQEGGEPAGGGEGQ